MTVAVVCVMGLPGAGKSTLCKYLTQSKEFIEILRSCLSSIDSVQVHWISFDRVESGLRGNEANFDPIVWRETRNRVDQMVTDIRMNPSLSSQLDLVLLDDNFYYQSMRRRYKPNGIIFICRPPEECIRQNQLPRDSSPVPEHVIHRMALLMEEPNDIPRCPVLRLLSENSMDAAAMSAQKFWQQVYRSATAENPDQQNLSLQITERERVLNTFESRLRRAVGHAITGNCFRKDLMRLISMRKRESLDRLKALLASGTVRVDEVCDQLESEFANELVTLV